MLAYTIHLDTFCSCRTLTTCTTRHSHPCPTHLVVILPEELECREALDLDLLHLVLGGVHLGNHHVLVVLKVFSQLVPDWSQLLAMSTPWSIWECVSVCVCDGGGCEEGGSVLTWESVYTWCSGESSVPMATTTINCWYHGNHYNELLVPWQPLQ